jgi:hypothetical protein
VAKVSAAATKKLKKVNVAKVSAEACNQGLI